MGLYLGDGGQACGAPRGSSDRDTPSNMSQRQWDQACDWTSGDMSIVYGYRASSPLLLTLPEIL